MIEIELKANEPYTYTADQTCKLTIYADQAVAVLHNTEPKTPLPGATNHAVFMFRVRSGDEVDFVPLSSAGVSIGVVKSQTASVYDPVDPESLVETLAPEEMNIYDKLRAEMLGMLSQFADKNDLDSIDESDDLDFPDDEDEGLIDTPYEYAAMMEEYPVEDSPTSSIKEDEGNSGRPNNVEDLRASADPSANAANDEGSEPNKAEDRSRDVTPSERT